MKNKEIKTVTEYIDRVINVIKSSKYSFIQTDLIYFIEEIKKQVEELTEDE